jgi:antibiotic biosynthesis monooxygenase (ABM) superfamily enzyme
MPYNRLVLLPFVLENLTILQLPVCLYLSDIKLMGSFIPFPIHTFFFIPYVQSILELLSRKIKIALTCDDASEIDRVRVER